MTALLTAWCCALLQGLQLGVVTAIAAPAALRVSFAGGGGHAGALLMNRRADAALAAAELALHVEEATLAHGMKTFLHEWLFVRILVWTRVKHALTRS